MPVDRLRCVETSFADAIAAIAIAEDLRTERQRQLACSLRVIAEMLGRPAELIPARWSAVRQDISRLHHAERGITAKTLANHISNVRFALSWMADSHSVPQRGAPLSAEWQRLRAVISGFRVRTNLSALMRYCSARGLAPSAVDDAVLDAFMDYRRATTALACSNGDRRRIIRAWNTCVETVAGWPNRLLVEQPSRSARTGPAWADFPVGLRMEIDSYLAHLTKIRRTGSGRRQRPCKPSTLRVRKAKLIAFVRKAVALGIPLEALATLAELLHPDVVERVLTAYCDESGETPSVYTIELAALLANMGRQLRCLDEDGIERLDNMRLALENDRSGGLTEKNRALIRRVISPGVWAQVVSLPGQLMREARLVEERSPVKAAGLAQRAVAIGILSVAPVRLGNLGTIRVGVNLVLPSGPDGCFWLVFPDHDVKNRVRLEFPLDDELSALIREYLHCHRAVLQRGSSENYLFPGFAGGFKGTATLSEQIKKTIAAATGLRITVHQFRHAAAALILQAHPGNYEFVRRILGHKNLKTTIDFYVGLETAQAARVFGEIVHARMRSTSLSL